MTKSVVVKSTVGLHAALAAKVVQAASKYNVDINLIYNDKTIDVKSILRMKFDMNEEECEEESSESYSYVYYDIEYEYEYTEEDCEEEYEYIEYDSYPLVDSYNGSTSKQTPRGKSD